MSTFTDAQRRNIDEGERTGRISKATADAARAKLGNSSSNTSTSSNSNSNNKSSGNSSSNNNNNSNITKTSNGGYAYTDKYGFSHVVSDYDTAKQYSGNGNIYDYTGSYGGGYAVSPTGGRVNLNLPGAKNFGNNDPSKGDLDLSKTTDYNKYISSLIDNPVASNDIAASMMKNLTSNLTANTTPVNTVYTANNTNSTPTSYAQHLAYFLSPQAYANAIKEKETSGQQLDDPIAAAAFKADYPQYFSNVADNTVNTNDLLSEYLNSMDTVNYDDIYNSIMSRLPEYEMPSVLSYSEAQNQAENQLNPLYDKTLKNTLNAVDESNIRRGFFGQLPGAELSRSTAADIEGQRAADIAQLAAQIQGQSQQTATQQAQLAAQQRQSEADILMNALNQAQTQKQNNLSDLLAIMNYYAGREDKDSTMKYQQARDAVNDALNIAQLTGNYNGKPTLDYLKYQSSPESQPWYNDLYKQGLQADIAAKNRSNTNGGSSSGSKDALSKTATNNAIAQVYTYGSKEEALAALEQYGQAMANQGVDLQAVYKAIDSRWAY